ncbi:MAG TPA: hypothetical protein VE978_26240 [Chitinophagales bacterium]|nr:hypothetical protein [Chitinophagales bacterium]
MAIEKEKQTSEREKVLNTRQDELYNLALDKEKEASERDRSIFKQSSETLNLVNQTLGLARDASKRASESLAKRLNKQHDELEQESSDLIEEAKADKNFKILVEDSNFRSNLLTLSLDIGGLQNNQNILDEETILHPYCSFIRGMDFHLNQHFKPAIKFWKQAKDHKNASTMLKIMALYWIGYEQNNLKDFENATSNFEMASGMAEGELKFEFERIKIESKFFNYPTYTPDKLIGEVEHLFKEINDAPESSDYQKVRSAIAGTLGNIYYELGISSNDAKASDYFQKAKAAFDSAPIKNKWIWFGFGEACFKLNQFEEAEKILKTKVKDEAELEYSTRLEPRTKVLGQTTVLICSARIKSLNGNVTPLYNLIKTTLGGVDERLTVYSQFQRRNVDKKQFISDLDKFVKEFNDSLASES